MPASDTEPPHPAEPVQVFDGPTALYIGTARTMHSIEVAAVHYGGGGAASTGQVASPAH
jgi:hypothetical protein